MIRILWFLIAAASAAIVATRFEPVVDLAWFLPAPESPAEHVLLERLGQGPGSQLMFLSLQIKSGSDAIAISEEVVNYLAKSDHFSRIVNGQADMSVDAIPEAIWNNRYLLVDTDLSSAGLRSVLRDRYADMAVLDIPAMERLLVADPTFAAVTVLEDIGPVSADDLAWISEDRRTVVLVAETRAAAFDLAGQTAAVEYMRALDLPQLERVSVHGMGVYGVDLQDSIRNEASLRSMAATIAVLLIFFAAYRRLAAVLFGFLPLLLGALCGLAMISLLYGKVHGITLAFGFTLLGVAIDYPLHYLSHLRGADASDGTAHIWPTMRIGMLSTVAAFIAIAAGGSTGLAQMGIFSATGLITAYLATRTLMPLLPAAADKAGNVSADAVETPVLQHGMWISSLLIAALCLATVAPPDWTNDLSAVTPVARERIVEDQRLRADFGAPDLRTVAVVRGKDLQPVLEQTEALGEILAAARQNDFLADYQSVSALLPSERVQKARLAAINSIPERAEVFRQLAVEQGFRQNTFEPFLTDLTAAAQRSTLLAIEDYDGTSLANLISGNLYRSNDGWVSLISLYDVSNSFLLEKEIKAAVPSASLIDLKSASESLMQNYRVRVVQMLLIALAAIAAYLWFRLRSGVQLVWVLGMLITVQMIALVITTVVLGSFSIFNLIAAVLVAGLGLDYTLFFARRERSAQAQHNTFHAVTICALSTCTAFVILAFSSIPVLQSIGVTVSSGVAASYLLACFGRAAT